MSRVWLASLLLGLVTAATAAARTVAPPVLHMVSPKPVVVTGAHFKAQEKVKLTLRTPTDVLVRRTTASRRGSFRSDFGTVTFGRCGSFTVRAVGAKGSSAMLKLPLPACMPARSP